MPHTRIPAPRRYFTEFLGTAVLVIVGAGASIVAYSTGTIGNGLVALAFGAVVAIIIVVFGTTSGAHINPAVTIAFWSVRKFPSRDVIPYVTAQCAGATAGAFVLQQYFGYAAHFGGTVPTVSTTAALAIEAAYSAILAFVIGIVSSLQRPSLTIPPVAIGFTVFVGAFITGPFSGGSFNPARTLGPAIVSGVWADHWIFRVAPIGGMLLAMNLHKRLSASRMRVAATSAVTGVEGAL